MLRELWQRLVLLPRKILLLPVLLYRLTLSRIMPPICRFKPTCSEYMVEALTTHGAIRGLLLGTWRVLRCQPFARSGWDPVPPKKGEVVVAGSEEATGTD